jgi:hypothetical protein
MEIHFACNDKHFDMFCTYCKPSIPLGLTPVEHRLTIKSAGEYMKHGYMKIICAKMRLIIDSLKSSDSNEPVIWCDSDVIFNTRYKRSFLKQITLELEKSNKSILYQRENRQFPDMINGGFFIAQRNDFSISFYSHILQLCLNSNDKHDQDFINEYITQNSIEAKNHIGTLPLTYASASNGGFRILNRCQLFHCNCTPTVADKMKMLGRVNSRMV